ncbi:MAG: fibronectin type III domain-containing protein [Chlorobi bacterium]|nr:fibronectin type III domain-containing protein [Chlorobiota bacterium]
MKKMKTFTKTFIWMLAVVVLATGCKKDNPVVDTHDDAYGDVLLKKMLMMGQVKYVPIFFAGGEGIVGGESKVVAPDGSEYPLNEFWAGPGILMGKGEVRDVFDFAGEYVFKLKFEDGYEKEVTDYLENVEIDIPMVTAVYDRQAQTIEVSWTPVPGADLYCVKLTELDMSKKPFFKIPQLPTNVTSYTIRIDGGTGWMRPTTELVPGEEYYVVVAAKKVEQGAEVSGNSKDFQTSSCNKTTIVY